MKRLQINASLADRLQEMHDTAEVEGVRIWREMIGDLTEYDARLIETRRLELERRKK